MNGRTNLAAGLIFLLLGLGALFLLIPHGIQVPESLQYQALSPAYWPNIVAGSMTAIGAALLLVTLLRDKMGMQRPAEPASGPDGQSLGSRASRWTAFRPFGALAICFGLYFGLEPLGFVLCTAIALVLLMLLAGEFRIGVIIPISIIVPLCLYLFFTKAASVPIPGGVLEDWLLRL